MKTALDLIDELIKEGYKTIEGNYESMFLSDLKETIKEENEGK